MRRVLFACCLLAAPFATAESSNPLHVNASLIAGDVIHAPNAMIWTGLRMRHQPGWHTYWKNPGDAGMPTRIEWTLPDGWSAGGILWPAPQRIPAGALASYGYDGDLVLPIKLFPPSSWDGKTRVQISAHANWLVCKEQCIPENGTLTLALPATSAAAEQNLLRTWRTRVPQPFRFATASARKSQGRLVITLEPVVAGQFFPEREELIEPGDPPQFTLSGKRATWSARLGVQGKSLSVPATIAGVWVPEQGTPLFVTTKLE